MATSAARRPLPAAADLASQQRRLPFSSLLYQPGTPPEQHSPTNSVGSAGPGGLIYRDNSRDQLAMDLLNIMPASLRDSSPNGQQQHQQQQPQQRQGSGDNASYPRSNRVPPPSMGDGELDAIPPNGISPAGSLRRIPRENRGSSGSVNELGILPQDLAAAGAARERDRPDSRDRDRRDREKNGVLPIDKQEARRTPTNTQGGAGVVPNRPSPYSFDSTTTIKAANHSTTDLLALGGARDSPSYDNSALASLDPLQGDGTSPLPQKRQGSGDSLDLPNGEHGGWVSYESSEPGPQPQQRNADWDRKQANQAYSASRFSPDRFPLTEEQDAREEEILSIPRGTAQQTRSGHPAQPPQPSPTSGQSQPRRRDLPIPGQATQAMLHSRDHSGSSQPIIPVPKTHQAQLTQQWTRRPSSPLAREPVVAQNNTSSEDSDSYTPRSPHAALPDIPSVASSSYPANPAMQQQQQHQQQQHQQQQQYQHQSQPSPQSLQHLHNQSQSRPMPPPALVNRPRANNNQPMYEQQQPRGMPAMQQLPMYTGASMYTALSSISPSQSVSAVGSPHPQTRLPPGPPFGPSSSVFINDQTRNGKNAQMYPQLQHGMGNKGQQRGSGLGFSLDQQIAALTGQGYQALNSSNLAALKSLTAHDLRAMGFGQPQPAQPLRTPKIDHRQPPGTKRVVETLDKAAGEVVELQDLQRAMEMNLDQWDGRDWQGHHRPAHTGGSAQYPSSHAVLPPSDRAKQKAADDYEQQLQQLAALGINMGQQGLNMGQQNGTYSSSAHMHQRPGNPVPPTPFSATSGQQGPQFPQMIPTGDGWLPVPNTDGYPPSYGEILNLYEQHNPGKQPNTREVLLMQLAALASEPENIEGSVFSKSETPFPPAGFNPFIQSHGPRPGDSARSSPRDPPGEFDKMLRRVGTFNQPPRRTVGSSVFGGDGETEVSRMAPSSITDGAGPEDDGETTEEDTRGNSNNNNNNTNGAAGLGLNLDNSTTDTLPMGMQSMNNHNEGPSSLDLYPLLSALKSRAASVAPPAFMQQQQQPQPMINNQGQVNGPWVEENDSDEDLETELDVWGDEDSVHVHPRFIRDEAKRRRKWEIKFAELVKAFHELDRLTDTPMILLATPPRSSATGPNTQPVSHLALSRSIKRDQGYNQRAHEARQSYHNILVSPPTSRAASYQSASSPNMSPPTWGPGGMQHRGWSSGSAASASDADSQMRAQMVAALGSLRLMSKVEERREERRRQEVLRQKDEREAVERLLKGLLTGAESSSAAGSQRNGGSVSNGSPAGGSVRAASVSAESVGTVAPAEDLTPQTTSD